MDWTKQFYIYSSEPYDLSGYNISERNLFSNTNITGLYRSCRNNHCNSKSYSGSSYSGKQFNHLRGPNIEFNSKSGRRDL